MLRLLLIESYLGVDKIHGDHNSLLNRFNQGTQSVTNTAKFGSLIAETGMLLNMNAQADVKGRVEALIGDFRQRP